MQVDNLIIGAGLSAIVLAQKLANELKESVLIIERRGHIAGNIYDYDNNGILIHKYGAHIFHTNETKVWHYLTQFSDFYPYMHEVKAQVDGMFVPVPFNLNSLYQVFPKNLASTLENELLANYTYGSKISILELHNNKKLKFISDFIYEKVFLHYTLKQWQCTIESLDRSVFERVPIAISKDNRYFQDIYQGMPAQGYTKMCENMLQNPRIQIQLNTDYLALKDKISYKRLFFSGAIDEFFEYKFGILPYRSLDFTLTPYEKPYFQSNSVINYPNNYDFTRIIEHKYFLDSKTNHTIVSFEYPKTYQIGDERYYPVPNKESAKLYQQYTKEAQKLKNTYFIGRLGWYQYLDMDKVVLKALELFDFIKENQL